MGTSPLQAFLAHSPMNDFMRRLVAYIDHKLVDPNTKMVYEDNFLALVREDWRRSARRYIIPLEEFFKTGTWLPGYDQEDYHKRFYQDPAYRRECLEQLSGIYVNSGWTEVRLDVVPNEFNLLLHSA